jgi:hypothetical protein
MSKSKKAKVKTELFKKGDKVFIAAKDLVGGMYNDHEDTIRVGKVINSNKKEIRINTKTIGDPYGSLDVSFYKTPDGKVVWDSMSREQYRLLTKSLSNAKKFLMDDIKKELARQKLEFNRIKKNIKQLEQLLP